MGNDDNPVSGIGSQDLLKRPAHADMELPPGLTIRPGEVPIIKVESPLGQFGVLGDEFVERHAFQIAEVHFNKTGDDFGNQAEPRPDDLGGRSGTLQGAGHQGIRRVVLGEAFGYSLRLAKPEAIERKIGGAVKESL